MLSLKDQMKAYRDVKTLPVHEWGVDFFVKALSYGKFMELVDKCKGKSLFEAVLWDVLYCSCDADGNNLFDESDLTWLREKSYGTLNAISKVCHKINRLDEEVVEEQGKG